MSAAPEGLVQVLDAEEALAGARVKGQNTEMGKCEALELGVTE